MSQITLQQKEDFPVRTAIGFYCRKDGFEFVVLRGTRNEFQIVERDSRTAQADLSAPQLLDEIAEDIEGVLRTYKPDVGAFREIEPFAKTKSSPRMHMEGVLMLTAYRAERRIVMQGKIAATIKSDLKLKQKTKLDQFISEFSALHIPKKYHDAFVTALSCLDA